MIQAKRAFWLMGCGVYAATGLAWGQVAIEHRMGATAMLAQMHGHQFALGVYLPTTLCLLLYLSSRIGAKEIAVVHLRVLTGMYHTGMTCTLALLIYKGYHFLGSVRGGITDFALIDATMFGGNAALREVFYAIAHGLLAAALIYFCVLLARSVHAARIGGYRPGS